MRILWVVLIWIESVSVVQGVMGGESWIEGLNPPVYELWEGPEDVGINAHLWVKSSGFQVWSPTPMYGLLPSPVGPTYQVGDRVRSSTGDWELDAEGWKPWPAAASQLPDRNWEFEGNGYDVINLPEAAIRSSVRVEANVVENSAGSFERHNRIGLDGLENTRWHFEEVLDVSGNCVGIKSRDVWDQGVKFRVYYRKMR